MDLSAHDNEILADARMKSANADVKLCLAA